VLVHYSRKIVGEMRKEIKPASLKEVLLLSRDLMYITNDGIVHLPGASPGDSKRKLFNLFRELVRSICPGEIPRKKP